MRDWQAPKPKHMMAELMKNNRAMWSSEVKQPKVANTASSATLRNEKVRGANCWHPEGSCLKATTPGVDKSRVHLGARDPQWPRSMLTIEGEFLGKTGEAAGS